MEHFDEAVAQAMRVPPIASGATIAARMIRMGRMERPVSMHRVVAEAMTIRETSFFRDMPVFQLLVEKILPPLLAKRAAERRLRLWSAGCATGQEAYSLAILLEDRFPQLKEWRVEIVGSDVSEKAIAYARRGRYSRLEMNRGLPARMMLRCFEPRGEAWAVRAALRRGVRFECADLRLPASEDEPFDVVLLRNVLPYFPAAERICVLQRVHERMRPGAALLLGAGEQADDAPERMELQFDEEHFFYRAISMG